MPYPQYVTVPTQSLPNLTTESDPASLMMLRVSAPAPVASPHTDSSDASSLAPKQTSRFGLGQVFAGFKKLFGSSRPDSPRISKPQPLRPSGGVGYVMPHENKGLNAHRTVGRRPTQHRTSTGRPTSGVSGQPASKVVGVRKAKAKSSMRSRRSPPHLDALAKMTGQHLSCPVSSLPDVIVSSPSLTAKRTLQRVHSFSKGDDAAPLLAPKSDDKVRPVTPVVSWTAHSSLFVTNPDDGASMLSATTAASSHGDDDVVMSGGLGNVAPIYPQIDKVPESYEEFKARFGGRPRPTGEYPPRLQFIPRLAPFHFDAEAPLPSDVDREDIQQHRNDALRALEGEVPLVALPQEALLASAVAVPLRDIPAALKPQMHPHSLLPGPRYQDHEGVERVRPMTYQETPPPDWKFEDPLALEGNDYNYMMKYHKARDSNLPAFGRPRMKTPESFASNLRHKSFYDQVEAGDFDDLPVERPANPSPPSTISRGSAGDKSSGNSIGRTFFDSPTPPKSRVPSADVASGVRGAKVTKKPPPKSSSAPNIARKAAQKPLPPTPAPRPTSGTIPARHKMNDNGYPVADLRGAGARYSATPSYQRRTVDSVEAKARKDLIKTKLDAKVWKAEEDLKRSKKQAKAAKKAAKKAEKEKKREKCKQRTALVRKQKEIDEGVRRLIYV